MITISTAKQEITIPKDLLPIDGFKEIHSPLYIRMIYLQENIEFLMVSIEMTSLIGHYVPLIKQWIVEKMLINPENIWITVTHTFAAPHLMEDISDSLKQEKNRQLAESVRSSIDACLFILSKNKQRVSVYTGHTTCDINIQRNIETKEGWGIGKNHEGITDNQVQSFHFINEQEKTVCVLFNYALQSSVLDQMGIVSYDVVGEACQYIEQHLDTMAMFLIGCAGDLAPNEDINKSKEENIILLGHRLGRTVCMMEIQPLEEDTLYCKTLQVTCPGQKIAPNCHQIKPTHYYEFMRDQERLVAIYILQIGSGIIIGVSPELNCETGLQIKKYSPFKTTIVATMVNGAAKYMPPKIAYERITYQAVNSFYAKNSAEILTEVIHQQLQKMNKISALSY